MITKHLFIIIFLFSGMLLYGQNQIIEIQYEEDVFDGRKMCNSTIYCDVENLSPVFKVVTDTFTVEPTKVNYYYYFKNSPKEVSFLKLDYEGGFQALTQYFDSVYYSKIDPNWNELNAVFHYTILFDKKLKIKEIKIIRRGGYNNRKYNYDKLIKSILLSTEGKWKKSNPNDKSKWYLDLGILRLK